MFTAKYVTDIKALSYDGSHPTTLQHLFTPAKNVHLLPDSSVLFQMPQHRQKMKGDMFTETEPLETCV